MYQGPIKKINIDSHHPNVLLLEWWVAILNFQLAKSILSIEVANIPVVQTHKIGVGGIRI